MGILAYEASWMGLLTGWGVKASLTISFYPMWQLRAYYNLWGMATERLKMVQNYCLEELQRTNADQSQIWIARHKILRKQFTLKRIKYRVGQGGNNQREDWCYRNAIRETELLKRFSGLGSPKCHKMIKTSNNIYLVYDSFPGNPLAQLQFQSSSQQLELLLNLSRTLSHFHIRGIVFLNISPLNVYVTAERTVFFSDWTLARDAAYPQKINTGFLSTANAEFAPELLKDGLFSQSSDIYSLGRIFSFVLQVGSSDLQSTKDVRLKEIAALMSREKPSERPTLREVMRSIELCMLKDTGARGQRGEEQRQLGHFTSMKNLISQAQNDRERTDLPAEINNAECDNNSISHKRSHDKITRPNNCYSPQLQHTASTKSINTQMDASRKREERNIKQRPSKIRVNEGQLSRKINKKRNLAYFLLDLSEFVFRVWVCPELGYLLLKQSRITMSAACQDLEPIESQSEGLQKLSYLLQEELNSVDKNLSFMKDIFAAENVSCSFRGQLDNDRSISQSQLKTKIIFFCKAMQQLCDGEFTERGSLPKMIEYLFKTYMILKQVEEGSYDRFWDRIYQNNVAHLQNQKYFKEERNMGFRYLKSKISEVLRRYSQ